ncbi:22227_t:CDS:1, partial [Gigaspora margarita]
SENLTAKSLLSEWLISVLTIGILTRNCTRNDLLTKSLLTSINEQYEFKLAKS